MFIGLFVIVLCWVWYSFGLYSAIVFAFIGLLVQFFLNRRLILVFALLSAIVILQLEIQFSHVLKRPFQHQIFPLTVCLEQPASVYDEYISANVRVIDQPEFLTLRRLKLTISTVKQSIQINPGDCIEGEFRLREPFGLIVPGAFNADQYYFANNIDAKGTLKAITAIKYQPHFSQMLFNSRKQLFETPVSQQVWAALMFGWSSSMSYELKDILSENQLVHLFVVSGMHVGLVGTLVLGILNIFLLPFSRWLKISNEYKFSVVLAVTFGYVAFLGWPVPAVRALIMAVIPLLIYIFGIKTKWYVGILISSIIVSVTSPEAWLSIGPWLSFISVLMILLIYRWKLISRYHWLVKLLFFQLIMSASIIPWAMLFNFNVNPLAGLINYIVTPIVSVFLLPLSLLITVFEQKVLLTVFDFVTENLIRFLMYTKAFSLELGWFHLSIVASICALFVLFVWGIDKKLKMLVTLSGLFIVTAVFVGFIIQEDEFTRLTFFDVGHGQSILIETPKGKWLYDTAGQLNEDTSVYSVYLSRTMPTLSGVIVSHSDGDHAAGIGDVLEDQPRILKWVGQPLALPVVSGQSQFVDCHQADDISESIYFIPIPKSFRETDNDSSCILVFRSNHGSFILTGDAGKKIEYYLLQEYPELFPFDLVLLGHHGSSTSSARDWLAANDNALFILSTGDRAAPKWPSKSIVNWFQGRNEQLLSTAQVGTIQIRFTDNGLKTKTWDSAYRNRLIY